MRMCSIENCNNKHHSNNYCMKHYYRFKRHGDPNIIRIYKKKKPCSVVECKGIHHSKGYCSYHYNKMIRNNSPPCKLCDQPCVAKGYCQKHYKRLNSHGDPLKTLVNTEHTKKCKLCDNEYHAGGLCKNHYINKYNKRKRMLVINHYTNGSMTCNCCGESIIEFLTVDHIDNNGAEHRKSGIGAGNELIRYIINNNFPEEFQILCYNCNCGKIDGKCPHLREDFK